MQAIALSARTEGDFDTATLPHLTELYQSAKALLSSESAAEDAVRRTYIRASQSFARLDRGMSYRVWLFSILHKQVVDRRGWRSSFWRSERLRRSGDPILQALRKMRTEEAEALVLCDVHGFTYQEACQILGTTTQSLQATLEQARDFLAAAVNG